MPLSASAYEDLIAHTSDVLTVFDEAGVIRYESPAIRRVLGYDPDELIGENVFEYIHPDDQEPALDTFQRVLEGETDSGAVELRFKHADGSWCWMESRGIDATGTDIDGFVVVSRDISDRKAAERARSDILDRMTDGFFALDTDWHVTYANDAGQELLGQVMGYDPATTRFEGRHLWEEAPEAVGTTFYDKYHEALETQEPVTFDEHYEPLDTWFSVRAFPSEQGLSVYFRDVTERHHREAALERRDHILQEIHSITNDRDRSFTEKVEALLALGREELGAAYGSLSHIDGDDYIFEVVDADSDDIQAGDVVPVEATNCELVATENRTLAAGDIAQELPDETDRAGYTEWGISCYLGAPVLVDGDVYGTFCFYDTEPREEPFSEWEVTLVDMLAQWASYELQRLATTRNLAEQTRRLDRFASIVSHDLRNPLNVLDGRLELARETGDDEHFDAAEQAIDRMETLIDDLLTLARSGMEIDSVEPVELEELVRECWAGVEAAAATLETEDAGQEFPADRSRVKQLLENLLRNAIDHGGDDVTIRVGSLADGFFVEDDGPGIPPTEREAVFEWGHSTRSDGTGFGLSIVKAIAEAHGWDIRVTDGDDGGARFEITGVSRPLPVA